MSSVTDRPFWSLHTHSKYSFNDAIASVQGIVDRAVQYGYPAIGLTDHGSVSGSVQLYRAARKAGIEPLPGIELYVVPDTEYAGRADNLHLTVAAYNERGYRNLMHMATLSQRRYWYKPRVDFADFAAMAEDGATDGLVVSTGCYFGVLPQVLMRRGHGAAVKVAETLAGWFPRVYVELQNHGVENHKSDLDITDDELVEAVFHVAQEAGLPCILARDSHYLDESDRHLHEALKRMISFSDDVDDAVFPGSGYFMTDTEGMRPYFEPKYLEAGLEGLDHLAGAAYLRLPELETFSMKVPDVSLTGEPQAELEAKVLAALKERGLERDPIWLDGLRQEFEVVDNGGMASYLLLVDDVCTWMREHDISYHARGSAAGSMINYLLGITQADPVRFGLRFDRFLSRNRMKPPDVDLDVEHTRRDEVIAYLQSRWAVRSVGSHMKYSLEEDESEEGSGSLLKRFFSSLRKRGIEPKDWQDIPKKDREELLALSDLKLYSGYGTHAAGYIVAPSEKVVSDLPLAFIASSKKMVTAYGKKDVEILGFLKLDLLGLRTRTAIKITEELTGISFDTIPENDKATFRAIAQGNVDGVFQLEGGASKRGCKDLKPTKLEDIIAAQALFRPATMNSGATKDYMRRRRKEEPVPARHEDIMKATAETYGVLLYQEQVMDVMETLGMSPAELEEMLDAVKASNEYSEGAAKVIAGKMPRIRELAHERGWTQIDIDWLVDGLGAYADYSFNKAHAASYGTIAYRTAYMKTHYPLEFWAGMLAAYWDAPKPKNKPSKERIYVQAARADGVRVLPPHVNKSKAIYAIDSERYAIRRGLTSVKGVGKVASAELEAKAPFTSLTDLGQRCLPKKVTGAKDLAINKPPDSCGPGTNIYALWDAGALEGLD